MRLIRWFVAVPVLAVAFVVMGASASQERSVPIREVAVVKVEVSAAQRAQLVKFRSQVIVHRLRAWRCQDALNVSRSRASTSVWALPVSVQYRQWTAKLWKVRAGVCEASLSLRTIPSSNDWQTSVRLVQRVFPGTSEWLLYISRREGGHGGFVMNHQGSGAGGWMQFMASTYYAYNDDAFAALRARGFMISESANAWTNPLGQAVTAAYMRYTGRDGCHWCL